MTEVHHLSLEDSIAHSYLSKLRNVETNGNREQFRTNLRRIGRVLGYEISKQLAYTMEDVQTPLALCRQAELADSIVAIAVMRAGLALHDGIVDVFPEAENGFISSYRKHGEDGSFEIFTGYVTCPDLTNKVLIISDPMLATGQSFCAALNALRDFGKPKSIHLAAVIASEDGVGAVKSLETENLHLWVVAIDPELSDKHYIIPGLGDAGDLAFGPKIQR